MSTSIRYLFNRLQVIFNKMKSYVIVIEIEIEIAWTKIYINFVENKIRK